MCKTENSELSITYVNLDCLPANPHNGRTHSKHQIRQIAASIKAFGFVNPVLVDRDNIIVAGHGRVEAARLLGIIEVPTVRLEGLTDDQIRAYIIADNRLAEMAGWDNSILAIELQHLLTVENGFDISITGFEVPEIDLIIEGVKATKQDEADIFDIGEHAQAVAQPGDIWQLGKHRILCGDALDGRSYEALMGTRRAHAVFTDPPYNVAIDGNVSGNGCIRHREFAMASGEMNEDQFVDFLGTSLRLLSKYSTIDSMHYVCMDWRHVRELLAAADQAYASFLNLCIWVKDNGGLGSLYRSRHELVFVFKNGKGRHRNNVQLGKFGRNRTNVWEYPCANTFSRQSEDGDLIALHPTVKPVALISDALLDCTARGEIVLDAFLGSGTTLIAAERVGRVSYGIEIDPVYVDVAVRRWQKLTSGCAVNTATDRTFDDTATGGNT